MSTRDKDNKRSLFFIWIGFINIQPYHLFNSKYYGLEFRFVFKKILTKNKYLDCYGKSENYNSLFDTNASIVFQKSSFVHLYAIYEVFTAAIISLNKSWPQSTIILRRKVKLLCFCIICSPIIPKN